MPTLHAVAGYCDEKFDPLTREDAELRWRAKLPCLLKLRHPTAIPIEVVEMGDLRWDNDWVPGVGTFVVLKPKKRKKIRPAETPSLFPEEGAVDEVVEEKKPHSLGAIDAMKKGGRKT